MGLIISRFRKKKSTKEVLEQIQKDVVQIEEYGAHTQQRQKRLVGSLVLYSAIFYLIAVAVYYFYYFPATTQDRLIYASPFVVFPVLIYLLKRLLSWYYRRKIAKNELKLKKLRDQKEQILEQVMETETYKVAKEILETYAPDQLRKTQPLPKVSPTPAPRMPIHSPQHSEVRRRVVNSPPQAGSGGGGMRPVAPQTLHHQTPVFPSRAPIIAQSAPARPGPGVGSSVRAPLLHGPPSHRHAGLGVVPVNPSYSTPATGLHSALPRPDPSSGDGGPPGPPMPRPVLPRERGYFDRFVEYLVGDGPANRFALVCRQCESHNGMALKDEFPYLAFRCAYCYYWNPARKQRPCAPRLEELMPQPPPTLATQDAQEDEDEEEEEEEEEEEQESSSDEEEEDEEDDDEGEEGGVDEEESGGSSSGEEEEEGAASSSEQSSTKATSSQEGSLEDVAKSSPTSATSTDPSSTSEDQLHHPQCTANSCPTTSSATTTSTSNTTSPSATENEETE